MTPFNEWSLPELPRLFIPFFPYLVPDPPPFLGPKTRGDTPHPPWVPPPQEAFWDALLGKRPSPYKKEPSALQHFIVFRASLESDALKIDQDKTGTLLWSRRHILLSRFHSLWKKKLSLQEKLQASEKKSG